MKKLALAALALASTSAFAQQKLGDLNFFQNQGSFYYKGSISNNVYTFIDKASNVETKNEGLKLANQLSYGILNNLNVFAEVSYKFENKFQENGTASGPRHYDNGLTNPGVGVNYRILNQPVFLDVFGKVNARLQDAEKGASRKDGNAAMSEDMRFLAGVSLGQRVSAVHEYRLTAAVSHLTDGEYDQKSTGATTTEETDSVTNFFAKANYQYRPIDPFMFDVAYTLERYSELTQKNKTSGSKTTYDAHNFHRLSFAAKYQILDNLLVSVIHEDVISPDYDSKFGNLKSEVKRQHNYSYALGLDLLF